MDVHSNKRKPSFIPQNKLVVGDIIALKEYDLHSSRLDDDDLFWSGVIVKLNKSKVTLCLSENNDTENKSSLPHVMGLCKV